jgi:hypothetical protein
MERNSEIDWAVCKELPATEFEVWERQKKRPTKKNTHTHRHTHFQSPDDQNTAHIAVATTKEIYLEEDIFTHKKNHTTLKKTPNKKHTWGLLYSTKSHNPKTPTTTHLPL